MKRTKYKIEQTDISITLYRRRFRLFWIPVETRFPLYDQHRINIIRAWKKIIGIENFI